MKNRYISTRMQIPDVQPQKFVTARVNGGMNTLIDASDIPNESFRLLKNCQVRNDRTSRRYGTSEFSSTEPDANPVLRFITDKLSDGVNFGLRFTDTTIHKLVGGVWTELTGPVLNTVVGDDRYTVVNVYNRIIAANNGANELLDIDIDANTYANLGNAPKFRFVTGFYDRVIGAALAEDDELLVGWSGQASLTDTSPLGEWDPDVDETAGNEPLITSPSDRSDFITGIFHFTSFLVIPRERSIWLGQKVAIPTAPFKFDAAIPSVGCDCPYSVQLIGTDSLAWLDRRTKGVYAYNLGGTVEEIGTLVERDILRAIDNPRNVFSGYDSIEREYHICIPLVTGVVVDWTYNLRSKTWAYNEYEDCTTIETVELGLGGLTIDELGDIPIEDLGTVAIDDLSPTDSDAPIVVRGLSDGNISVVDPTADTDEGTIYETVIDSKLYEFPNINDLFAYIRIAIEGQKSGRIYLYGNRTGDDDDWELFETFDIESVNKITTIKYQKTVRAKRFAWRLTAQSGLFDLLDYEVGIYPSGTTKEGE